MRTHRANELGHSDLAPGAVVGKDFRIIRQLGAGSTSSVWEAEHLRLGGRVAIKFLSSLSVEDPILRQRFIREARAVCKVRSQHIVQITDQGLSHGRPYLVMELLDGEDLGRLLARRARLSLIQATDITEQLCRGLDKAHRAGFVHRDIKPENVFVIHEPDGGQYIKLLDFGIVKQLGVQSLELTQDDWILGTAHYLSPEQITAPGAVDARADVWAVGVLLYRMLVGRVPFGGDRPQNMPELCKAIVAGQYDPPSRILSELGVDLDDWFQRALAVDRDARFESVRAASTALGEITRGKSSGVIARQRRAGAPARKARWRRAFLALLTVCAVSWTPASLRPKPHRIQIPTVVVQRPPLSAPVIATPEPAEAASPATAKPVSARPTARRAARRQPPQRAATPTPNSASPEPVPPAPRTIAVRVKDRGF